MKSLLIAKLVLVFLALAMHQGWIYLGDRKLFAEEPKNATKGDQKSAEASKTDELEDESEIKETNKRKSFLSDLFELPKLNSKKVQKEDIGKYMDMAERKERQISDRSAQLSRREEQLKSLEKSIEEKLQKLDEERKFIAKTLQQEKDLKGERLDKIAELYDKMDPKKAAPAFEKLDKDLTVALFKKLKQKQVTTILEAMPPEKSVELTEYFARIKSAKEYDLLKELNESLRKEFQDCKGMPVATAAQPSGGPTEGQPASPAKDGASDNKPTSNNQSKP
jgi:flagellar motility protein MotE (MotC chaperone)